MNLEKKETKNSRR